MSCSRWAPWQYDPADPRQVLGVGLLPLIPNANLPPGPVLDGPNVPAPSSPNGKTRPPQDMPPKAEEPPAADDEPAGTATWRPDVGTLAIGLGVGLVIASMLMGAGARTMAARMGGMA